MLRIELERRCARLTQAVVGRECDPPINPVTISQIERGRVNPTPSELRRCADVLGYKGDPSELAAKVSPRERAGRLLLRDEAAPDA